MFLHFKEQVYCTQTNKQFCHISGADEDSSLLGCDAVQTGEQMPMFHSSFHLLGQSVQGRPSLLDAEQENIFCFRNSVNYIPVVIG
jgi:hypothetical protein